MYHTFSIENYNVNRSSLFVLDKKKSKENIHGFATTFCISIKQQLLNLTSMGVKQPERCLETTIAYCINAVKKSKLFAKDFQNTIPVKF